MRFMPDYFKEALKDILTGVDGESYDIGRVLGVFAVVVYLGIGVHEEWMASQDYPFDFQAFGIGFGSLVTGVGILLKLKENTEPKL
jgi:hypothetical protein